MGYDKFLDPQPKLPGYAGLSGGTTALGLGPGLGRRLGSTLTPLGGVQASAFADGQAPPNGFHWVFLTDDITGQRITNDVTGQPVVDLAAN